MRWLWRREAPTERPADAIGRFELPLPLRALSANRLVAECEAFLAGRLADQIDTEVPVWSWTNLLAHGSEGDLAKETTGDSGDDWRRARAYLALSLLKLASTNGPLKEIQQRVMVPLELELAARPEVAAWEPRAWASTVEHALEGYRRQCRRSA